MQIASDDEWIREKFNFRVFTVVGRVPRENLNCLILQISDCQGDRGIRTSRVSRLIGTLPKVFCVRVLWEKLCENKLCIPFSSLRRIILFAHCWFKEKRKI